MPLTATFGLLIDDFMTSICSEDKFKGTHFPRDLETQRIYFERILDGLHEVSEKEQTVEKTKQARQKIQSALGEIKDKTCVTHGGWKRTIQVFDEYLRAVDPKFYQSDRKLKRSVLVASKKGVKFDLNRPLSDSITLCE